MSHLTGPVHSVAVELYSSGKNRDTLDQQVTDVQSPCLGKMGHLSGRQEYFNLLFLIISILLHIIVIV